MRPPVRKLSIAASRVGPPYVIKIEVDAVRTLRGDGRIQIRCGFVIDNTIETKGVGDEGAFFGSARNTNGAASVKFGDLTSHLSDPAGRPGDENDIVRRHLTNLKKSEICRESGAAQWANPIERIAEIEIQRL